MGRTGPGPIVARPIKNTNVRPVAWPRAKTSEFPRPGLPLAGPTQARPRPARAWPGLTLARGNTSTVQIFKYPRKLLQLGTGTMSLIFHAIQ